MLTCKGLRSAVLLSASLMVLGLVLEVVAEATGLVVPTSHLALFAVLAAAMVLAAITVVSLMPGAARRLAECQH